MQEFVDCEVRFGDGLAFAFVPAFVIAAEIASCDGARVPRGPFYQRKIGATSTVGALVP